MLQMFDELMSRTDHCHKRILVKYTGNSNNTSATNITSSSSSSNMTRNPCLPSPEPALFAAAMKIAREGTVEELLGSLSK